jgi:dihydrofolate reductase
MAKIYLSSIAAVARNNAIGKDNALLWHIPEDLKYFKKTTMGRPMIMGRKTFESFGKPLPGRPHIVISRAYKNLEANSPTPLYKEMEATPHHPHPQINEGPFLYASINEGIKAAKDMAEKIGVDEVFIAGGGEIYKQTLPMTERLYLTRIEKEYEGDTFFPELNAHEWHTVKKEHHEGDPSFTFYVLERK